MPNNRSFDSIELHKLDLPYNRVENNLSPMNRLVQGDNVWTTLGGVLAKRPGTLQVADAGLNKRIDRIFLYETLDDPTRVYLVASVYDSTLNKWQAYYNRLSGGTPGWTQISNLRDLNLSTRPHEMVTARGMCYIKSYPAASSTEKLGTVIFDGSATGPRTLTWGLLGPSIPARVVGAVTYTTAALAAAATSIVVNSVTGFPAAPFTAQLDFEQVSVTAVVGTTLTITRAQNGTLDEAHGTLTSLLWRNWNASTHQVDTKYFWRYSYAYKTNTGHISNIAPIEDNPDLLPSATGPFSNLVPQITVQGHADTTNIPSIVIFRTLDGGGTFYLLETITNTGSGAIIYTDDFRESGPTANASLTLGVGNASLIFTSNAALYPTDSGNLNAIKIVQGAGALAVSTNFNVTTLGWEVTITLAAAGSTAAQVKTAYDAVGTATAVAAVATSGGGGGTVLIASLTHLAGGTATGNLFNDPVSDLEISTADPSPTFSSNSPPPTVLAPLVLGVGTPAPSTPIIQYAGRFWMALGPVLLYSGQEEIISGIPEESWPTGFRGNFIRFPFPVTNLIATDEAIYIFTQQGTCYQLTGSNKETFNVRPIFDNLGAPTGHPRALARYGTTVAFLTHDYRIALLQNTQYRIISDPLYTDIIDAVNGGAELDIKYFGDLDKEWVVIAAHRADDPTESRQWIYDIKKSDKLEDDFWHPPWSIPSVCLFSGRIHESTGQRRLCHFAMNQLHTVGWLTRMDPTALTGTDYTPGTGNVGFSFVLTTNLFIVPAGDHVNTLRRPGLVPVVHEVHFDRALFAADDDPTFYYYKDDLWTDPIPGLPYEDPPRRSQSKGYKTLTVPINEVAYRFALKIQRVGAADLFEMHNLTLVYHPDKGA